MLLLLFSLCVVVSLLNYGYHVLAQFQYRTPIKSNNALILIAHPDDECMFFGPTISALRSFSRTRIHVLCLSTGNADGLGNRRKKELVKSCQVFGIQPALVKSLDHAELQDGMKNKWSPAIISNILTDYVAKHKIDTIITFDDYGVSGHPNHIAACQGAKHFKDHNPIQLYKLESIPLARKYNGIIDLLTVNFQKMYKQSNSLLFVSSPGVYLATHKAMRQHTSQLVWFRWLYVIFSRYMYINEISPVE